MAKLLKLRRGTTSQHSSFTGAEGEVTVDTTKDTLVVHNGSTAGGVPLAKEAGNIATATEATNVTAVANNSTDETVYPTFVDGATGTQGIETDTGFTYNPSSGKLTATEFVGNIDAVNGDFDGTLEADAITVDGVALNEYIADTVGAMVTGNTETGITVTYEDSDNTLDFVTGTVTEATNVTVSANNSTDETVYPTFVDGATGTQGIETDTGFTYNPSTGLITAVGLTLSGNLTVNGTTTTVASNTMTVVDKNIEIAKGAANDAAADGAGITVDSGDGDKTWNWVDATDAWTSSEHIHLLDNKKLLVGGTSGAHDGLEIYHDSSHNYIKDTGTGRLKITTNGTGVDITNADGSETLAAFATDGAVELYHNNSKKFETVSYGVVAKGSVEVQSGSLTTADSTDNGTTNSAIFGAGSDLKIYHNSTTNNSHIDESGTGSLVIKASNTHINSSADEAMIAATADGAVTLYHDASAKLATTAAGVTVTGTVTDSKGDLRTIPLGNITSAHTLVAADAGKSFTSTAGVTFPNSVFTAGQAITIINNSASDITLTQGSGATLYNTADGATGNRTLAARGMATALYVSASVAYISGAGLS